MYNRTTNTNATYSISSTTVMEDKPKSEYWVNLVYIFDEINPETGKRYYQSIPGCSFTLDSVKELCAQQVPSGSANPNNVINQMKAALPSVANNLLEMAETVPAGQRELVMLMGNTDAEGNIALNNLGFELYHYDTNKTKLMADPSKFKVKPFTK